MNPWWLRPPADESEIEPDRKSTKSTSQPKPLREPSNGRKAGSSEGNGRRRSTPSSSGRQSKKSVKKSAAEKPGKRLDRRIGLFCDVEDTALALREAAIKNFQIEWVVQRLLQEGSLIVRRAYADWGRFDEQKRQYHEAAFELVDIPRKYHSGKSGTDIKLSVDAIEVSFSKHHVDTIAIVSGDPDLRPLVAKLRENGKYVIGIGVEGSASKILVECCDEYIFWQRLTPGSSEAKGAGEIGSDRQEAFSIVVDAVRSLMDENRDRIWGSMIKQKIQRSRPSFSEGTYGYSAFSDLLEDVEASDLIRLERDDRSGGYVVTDLRES